MLKRRRLFLASTLSLALLSLGQAKADTVIGLNISGPWTPPHLAGETADGFSNWTDSQPVGGGETSNGNNIILNGSNSSVSASFSAGNLWAAGPEVTSEEQLYRIYLDDGGNGASISISGLSAWLASEQLSSYEVTVYQNTDNGLGFTPIDITTDSIILDTIQISDIVTTGSTHGKVTSRYLSADMITIKPQPRTGNDSTATRGCLSGVKITGVSKFYAVEPTPLYNNNPTQTTQQLSWQQVAAAADQGVTYNVYFGTANTFYSTDPNDEPNTPNPDYYGVNLVKTTTTAPADFFYAPTTALQNSTRYYWRVDALVPGIATPFTGNEWTFVTAPPSTVITSSPMSQTVAAGTAQVQLSVGAINATTYQWYKNGELLADDSTDTLYTGEDTATITIYDVQVSDEGFYHCIADNSLLQPVASNTAQLLTKRIMSWWKFDGNILDSVATLIPDATAHDGVMYSTPALNTPAVEYTGSLDYTNGMIDQGLKFNPDITLENSTTYFAAFGSNFDMNFTPRGFTVALWFKTTQSDWGAIIGKGRRETNGWIMEHQGNNLSLVFRGGGTATINSASIADGQWHLLVGTYDPAKGKVELYASAVDGAGQNRLKYASANTTPPSVITDQPMTIGVELDPTSTNIYTMVSGEVDDVRMYSYAMTDLEIAELLFNPATSAQICVESQIGAEATYDFNNDCHINILDLASFAQYWMECNIYPNCQ